MFSQLFLQIADSRHIRADFRKQLKISVHALFLISKPCKLCRNAFCPYLIHLVKAYEHLVIVLLLKSAVCRHPFQYIAVIDVHSKILKIKFPKHRRSRKDQLYLRKASRLPKDVDVALYKLPETAFLRAVRPPHIPDLHRLKGRRKLVRMVSIIPGKRHGKIIAKPSVNQILLLLRRVELKLFPAL